MSVLVIRMLRIVLAGGHPLMQEVTKLALEKDREFLVVGRLETLPMVSAVCQQEVPDIVIFDLLASTTNLADIKIVIEQCSTAKWLVLHAPSTIHEADLIAIGVFCCFGATSTIRNLMDTLHLLENPGPLQ